MSGKTQANNLFHIRQIEFQNIFRQNIPRRALLKKLIRHVHRLYGFTSNISFQILLNYLPILRDSIAAQKERRGYSRFRHSRIDRISGRLSSGKHRELIFSRLKIRREIWWEFCNHRCTQSFNCRVPVSTISLKLKNVKDYMTTGRIRDNSSLCTIILGY